MSKATFREGKNSSSDVAILEDRMKIRWHAIIGVLQENLTCRKFVFTIYLIHGISIKD